MNSRDVGNDARNLLVALDLYQAGEDLMRENLRRSAPNDSLATLDDRLNKWLRTRPGAEFGDSAGRPVTWPRTPK